MHDGVLKACVYVVDDEKIELIDLSPDVLFCEDDKCQCRKALTLERRVARELARGDEAPRFQLLGLVLREGGYRGGLGLESDVEERHE